MVKFCANTSIAEQYVVELRSIIDRFQTNATASAQATLAMEMGHLVAYVQNDENVRKISGGECMKFVEGLMKAKNMDREEQRKRREVVMKMHQWMHEAARKVNGGKEFDEF